VTDPYTIKEYYDMIITGGMNVYSTEVEEVLTDHLAVKDIAVIGIPDEEWSEAIHAVVVCYEDEPVTEEELLNHADLKMANCKEPKAVEFREALPRTSYDKMIRSRFVNHTGKTKVVVLADVLTVSFSYFSPLFRPPLGEYGTQIG